VSRLSDFSEALAAYLRAAHASRDVEPPTRTWTRIRNPLGPSPVISLVAVVDYVRQAGTAFQRLNWGSHHVAVLEAVLAEPQFSDSGLVGALREAWGTADRHFGNRNSREVENRARALLLPVLERYFQAAGPVRFSRRACANATEWANQLLGRPGTVTTRTVLLSNVGMRVPRAQVAPGIVVRRVNIDELEAWVNGKGLFGAGGAVPADAFEVMRIEAVAEIEVLQEAEDIFWPSSGETEDLMCAARSLVVRPSASG
jgi:hypothetical protein